MVEYLENFLTNAAVKEFWKSVDIWQSYDKKSSVLFFWDSVHRLCFFSMSTFFSVLWQKSDNV